MDFVNSHQTNGIERQTIFYQNFQEQLNFILFDFLSNSENYLEVKAFKNIQLAEEARKKMSALSHSFFFGISHASFSSKLDTTVSQYGPVCICA
jgi:hypothetical protein